MEDEVTVERQKQVIFESKLYSAHSSQQKTEESSRYLEDITLTENSYTHFNDRLQIWTFKSLPCCVVINFLHPISAFMHCEKTHVYRVKLPVKLILIQFRYAYIYHYLISYLSYSKEERYISMHYWNLLLYVLSFLQILQSWVQIHSFFVRHNHFYCDIYIVFLYLTIWYETLPQEYINSIYCTL